MFARPFALGLSLAVLVPCAARALDVAAARAEILRDLRSSANPMSSKAQLRLLTGLSPEDFSGLDMDTILDRREELRRSRYAELEGPALPDEEWLKNVAPRLDARLRDEQGIAGFLATTSEWLRAHASDYSDEGRNLLQPLMDGTRRVRAQLPPALMEHAAETARTLTERFSADDRPQGDAAVERWAEAEARVERADAALSRLSDAPAELAPSIARLETALPPVSVAASRTSRPAAVAPRTSAPRRERAASQLPPRSDRLRVAIFVWKKGAKSLAGEIWKSKSLRPSIEAFKAWRQARRERPAPARPVSPELRRLTQRARRLANAMADTSAAMASNPHATEMGPIGDRITTARFDPRFADGSMQALHFQIAFTDVHVIAQPRAIEGAPGRSATTLSLYVGGAAKPGAKFDLVPGAEPVLLTKLRGEELEAAQQLLEFAERAISALFVSQMPPARAAAASAR